MRFNALVSRIPQVLTNAAAQERMHKAGILLDDRLLLLRGRANLHSKSGGSEAMIQSKRHMSA